MTLHIHSDASYLSKQNIKSCVGGHYYHTSANGITPSNGAILTLLAIMKHVVASAAEAKLDALFYFCKNAIHRCITLVELGYCQAPTTIVTNNKTANGILQNTMVPKASKSMDVRFDWLKYWHAQSQFNFKWQTEENN